MAKDPRQYLPTSQVSLLLIKHVTLEQYINFL